MPRVAKHLRFLAITLAVIAGVLSAANDATAATKLHSARSARSCCETRVCPAGCCVPLTAQRPHRVASSWPDQAALPASSCRCIPPSPAIPADEQDATPIESSPADHAELDAGTALLVPPPRPCPSRNTSADVGPRPLALYLRHARLLF